ncbi:MAG: hypothetical protein WC330_02975 [Candidatus Omnitrophota bacterium]|jgi:hypothetical protein
MLDFTIKTLLELYTSFSQNGYKIINVSDFLQKKFNGKVCILRHDIDGKIKNALRLAYIEKKINISASYYFRYPNTYDKNTIKNIYDLGHEIGYHYEVLTKAKGNYDAAMKIFNKELEEFRKTVPIKTICAHGSPLSKWDNKKLWEKYDFQKMNINTDANLSFDFNDILYLTDTGRSWNKLAGNIKDRVKSNFDFRLNGTKDVILALESGKLPDKIMLNTHPQRWTGNLLEWIIELVAQNFKNLIKLMLIKIRRNNG